MNQNPVSLLTRPNQKSVSLNENALNGASLHCRAKRVPRLGDLIYE
jgi:hypothetical protein